MGNLYRPAAMGVLCLLIWTGDSLAASTSDFYLNLLHRGMAHFDAGQHEPATRELRLAAFGLMNAIPQFETAHIYLAIASQRLGREAEARTSTQRVIAAERIEKRYAALNLQPSIRNQFEQLAAKYLSAEQLATLRSPAKPAEPPKIPAPAPQTTEIVPPRTSPPLSPPPPQKAAPTPVPAPMIASRAPEPGSSVDPVVKHPEPEEPRPTAPSPSDPITKPVTTPEPAPAQSTATPPVQAPVATPPPPSTQTAVTTPATQKPTPVENPPQKVPATPPAKVPTHGAPEPPETTRSSTSPQSANPAPAPKPTIIDAPSPTRVEPSSSAVPDERTPKSPQPIEPAVSLPAPAPIPAPVTREGPTGIEAQLRVAEQALAAKDTFTAADIYGVIVANKKVDRVTLLRIGTGAAKAENYAAALQAFTRVGPFSGKEAQHQFLFAVSLYEVGKYREAKRQLAAVLPRLQITPAVAGYRAKIEGAIE